MDFLAFASLALSLQSTKLDTPITLYTDPVKLPTVLADLEKKTGVRITSADTLDKAIVVVAVDKQPAQEVLRRLADGIGATVHVYSDGVGVGFNPPGKSESNHHEDILKGYIDWLYTYMRCDKPLDYGAVEQAAGIAKTLQYQSTESYVLPYPPSLYDLANRSPLNRLIARLFKLIDPQMLSARMLSEGSISFDDVSEEVKGQAIDALKEYRTEQAAWQRAFGSIRVIYDSNLYPREFREGVVSQEIDGFSIAFKRGAMPVTFSLLSGKQAVLRATQFLPNEGATSWMPASKSLEIDTLPKDPAPLSEARAQLNRILADYQRKNPIDAPLERAFDMISKPRSYDPLSFTRAQPLAWAGKRLGQNLIVYLDDVILNRNFHLYGNQEGLALPDVLRQTLYLRNSTGLRVSDGWVLAGVKDPPAYLRNQIDRHLFEELIGNATRPARMTIDEFFALKDKFGNNSFSVAYDMAALLHPGYQTLHQYHYVEAFMTALTPEERSRLMSSGLPASSLGPAAFAVLAAHARDEKQRDKDAPAGTYNSIPSLDDIRRARVSLKIANARDGLLVWHGGNDPQRPPKFYCMSGYYRFYDLKNAPNAEEMLKLIFEPVAWPCQKVEATVLIEIPGYKPVTIGREHLSGYKPVMVGVEQLNVDLSARPMSAAELRQWLGNYYGK